MEVRLGAQNQEGHLLFTILKYFKLSRKRIVRSFFLSQLQVKHICVKIILLIELAEWSIAAVLKTVDCYRSGGSAQHPVENPSLSAQSP
jgi:hypothetical protein